jgi:hypothetical protein
MKSIVRYLPFAGLVTAVCLAAMVARRRPVPAVHDRAGRGAGDAGSPTPTRRSHAR